MKLRWCALAISILLTIDMTGTPQAPSAPPPGQAIKVGVTSSSYDDVGRIIRNIGSGIQYDNINRSIGTNFDRLSEYQAIFINCGSSDVIDSSVLRRFVEEGGVVYASDLAEGLIIRAFPGMFRASTTAGAQTVRNASIVHTSLATHMGRSQMNITFNLGGWAVVSDLTPDATVYIRGDVSGYGERALAFSFDYGRGRVFFTSFHNQAQANAEMVSFIEYLVFRMAHMEAERALARIADSAGYVFDGSVFGVLGESQISEPFFYTPSANDFMLLFDPDMGDFTIMIADPTGRVFSTEDIGILTALDINPEDLRRAFEGFPVELITSEMIVESLGSRGFRVLNPISGDWSFWVRSNNVDPEKMFAVGLAERPTAALTRAMFAQVIANLDGVDLSEYQSVASTFVDSPSDAWYYRAVEWAARQGLAHGVGNRQFAPNSPLTREQMVTMLYNYSVFKEIELPVLRVGVFPDHDEISDWALEAVMALYSAEIIGGRPDGSFDPHTTSTTTEIAYIFENFLRMIPEPEPEPPDPDPEPPEPGPEEDSSLFPLSLPVILGGIGLIIIIAGLVVLLLLRKRSRQAKENEMAAGPAPGYYDAMYRTQGQTELLHQDHYSASFEQNQYVTPPAPGPQVFVAPIGTIAQPYGKQCPSCGTALNMDDAFCVSCGQPTTQEEPPRQGRVCEVCKNTLNSDAQFCGYCGHGFTNSQSPPALCGRCGTTLPDGIQFCGNCGSPRG